MKKVYILVLALIYCFCSYGQITVTSSSFPSVGDTLFTATDNLPTGIDLGTVGGNQSYDFGNLESPFVDQTIFIDPSEGDHNAVFSSANLLVKGQAGESYFRSTNTLLELLGTAGENGFILDSTNTDIFISKYDPYFPIRNADITLGSTNIHNYDLLLAFGADIIPGAILDSLPIAPDSIRLKIESTRVDNVDAWGSMEIPLGNFDVLREKQTEFRETFAEAKVPFLGWIDISDFAGGLLPFLGVDTFISYNYINDISKEIIAEVEIGNNDTITAVTYKADPNMTTAIRDINSDLLDMAIYPNPIIDTGKIALTSVPPGTYQLVIYNMLGVEQKRIQLECYSSDKTFWVDFKGFRKGTYLYSLEDHRGKNLLTKRMVVMRP